MDASTGTGPLIIRALLIPVQGLLRDARDKGEMSSSRTGLAADLSPPLDKQEEIIYTLLKLKYINDELKHNGGNYVARAKTQAGS